MCPFRHYYLPAEEKKLNEDLTTGIDKKKGVEQSIKDRFHGSSDPLAIKLLSKVKNDQGPPDQPDDLTITTLFIGGVPEHLEF